MNKKRKKKTLMLLVVMAAMLLLPFHVSAQGGGVFGMGKSSEATENAGLMDRGATGGYNLQNQQFGSDANGGYGLFNQTFGQESPVGSGLAIFMVAGMGYAAMKSRKKNQKSNK